MSDTNANNSMPIDDCQKKAAELGFDLTKQFLTLAFAGIAFIVGLSFNTPGSVSSLMLWAVISAFGLSAALGLLFLMRGVNLLSVEKSYNIYSKSLTTLASLQILFVLLGTVLLLPILRSRPGQRPGGLNSIEIRIGQNQSVTYPMTPDENLTIELDGQKLKISAAKN